MHVQEGYSTQFVCQSVSHTTKVARIIRFDLFFQKMIVIYWLYDRKLLLVMPPIVTQLKIGDVCLFVYMFGRTYIILYFDPLVFLCSLGVRPRPKLH